MPVSGEFHIIPIGDITVSEDRQRHEMGDIEELALSLSTKGLIHPLVVTRSMALVAGERRLRAAKSLGWQTIAIQYVDELDPMELEEIELEENVKRKELTWQERAEAINRYHQIRSKASAEWRQSDTAKALNLSQSEVSRSITADVAIKSGNEKVARAGSIRAAQKVVFRDHERAIAEELNAEPVAEKPKANFEIVCADFVKWAQTYEGPRFNFLHCDFPYGVNLQRSEQAGTELWEEYDDRSEVYELLIQTLLINKDRLLLPSCHFMFWFPMQKYSHTIQRLEPFHPIEIPLIWHKSDNRGIASDVERRPRHIYETAFFGSTDNRKIIKLVSDTYPCPTARELHISEKPEPMLRHFFQMIVDENTVMLDPTCGSGTAIRAAMRMGAKHGLGLEINPEIAKVAQTELDHAIVKMSLEDVL